MAKAEEYNGVQKAAILLIALGPELSADVFKHLKEEEIEELIRTGRFQQAVHVMGWMLAKKQ